MQIVYVFNKYNPSNRNNYYICGENKLTHYERTKRAYIT